MELGKVHLNLKTLLLTMMMFKWGTLCSATSEKCLSAPCQNGATCVDTMDDYACICAREGVIYMGKNCDELYDGCFFVPCLECTSTPGTMEYQCVCPDGLTGDNCTEEVDDCLSNPCSEPHSLCVDQLHGYFCRCPAGYGGQECNTRVTDCIDKPCMNNGTCVLQPNGFECHCAPGFKGMTCEEDVNECLSEPCQNGAICIDGVAEYHCFCVPGFQGHNCEIDINECASQPCENNATCINEKDHYECECMVGFTVFVFSSYECNCSNTGFEGKNCEVDIAECASDPCQHGATCLEEVKGYMCLCWPGYEGPNCEVDIDECAKQPCQNGGKCLERSDPSHWELDWELSFAEAAGYTCQCQGGFAGENCSININECESEPCQNGGSCEDEVNGYTCVCPVGFLGELCELNIDECESQPCQNGGWCEDGRASYICHCPEAPPGQLPWGGDDCEVKLYGCVGHECQNGASCLPTLQDGRHSYTCLCPYGFYDEQCSTRTTFSLSTPGFIHIQVPLKEKVRREVEHRVHHGLGLQLRFRTTLPSMLIFYRGDLDTYFLLEIVNGGLHATAFSEESELDVTFPGPVNDGDWRNVHVFLDNGVLFLLLKGPNCDKDGCTVTDVGDGEPPFQPSTAFINVYIGGAPKELLELSLSRAGFLGCIEDLIIDSKPILPQALPEEQYFELGCSKTEWCKPDPCNGHGHCVDLWTDYQCDCTRPFHGDSCSEEYFSWTYSHEETVSFSSYDIKDSHGSNFSVSFFLKSVKPDGLIFQLRRPSAGDEGEVYFSIYLRTGRVFVSSLPDSFPLTAPVFVTNGQKQFLSVEVKHTSVIFDHAGLNFGIGEIPEVTVLGGDKAYVGGLPEGWDSDRWGGHFKGCLQDVRLDSAHLDPTGWSRSDEIVYVSNESGNWTEGCISDDTCKTQPCQNGGECSITFNDFICSCQEEYTGKTCQTRVWCVSNPCIHGGVCVDLPDGYECLHNATFQGNPVQYSAGGSLAEPVSNIYMELRTRSENAVLLRASWGSNLLMVGILDFSVWVEIQTDSSMKALTLKGIRPVADGRWQRINISMADWRRKASPWIITLNGVTDVTSKQDRAGSLSFLNKKGAMLTVADSFTGCLGAVRLGGVYLPFVDDHKAPQPSQFHLLGKPKVHLGCSSAPVCESGPCLNGATCEDLFNKFGCVCDTGWEGERCEMDTDDCASQPCVYGSCKDYLGSFECHCDPGYAGTLCDEDIDECELSPCEHGGTCLDGVNMYTCLCPKDYSGPRCQWDYPPLQCKTDVQCENDGICRDGLWGANCTCMAGFTGSRCETEIDECNSNPCQNGGSCLDRFNMFVCECPPGYSGPVCDVNKEANKQGVSWLMVVIPLLCLCVVVLIIGLTFMLLTARKKRQSEGAYSPSAQELAGARLEMDSMLKVPPEERLI
ncbi:PREDICTED: protein crumbs homolog 2-like [Cyprinodon variegatus]|uniref:protein crumbs homolog 2-like n=1 Tax=Cyprinodon variegatus TaxID=28743 RepID=UPI0007426A29|nr:PREDICTED: protein crumbs homolog 2-like [Cyprinodon variegatus]